MGKESCFLKGVVSCFIHNLSRQVKLYYYLSRKIDERDRKGKGEEKEKKHYNVMLLEIWTSKFAV